MIWAAESLRIRERSTILLLLAAAWVGCATVAPGFPMMMGETERLASTPATPRPGDACVVCNKPVSSGDKVYLLDGQRVAVHAGECELALDRSPEQYLAKVKPQGNQFMDAESGRSAHSWSWLIVGLYVLVGLIFAGLCSYRAVNRGVQPLPWFFAGLFFNALAYLALLSRARQPLAGAGPGWAASGLTKVPATHAPRACPQCGRLNHPSAERCSACGARLEPRVISEVTRAGMKR